MATEVSFPFDHNPDGSVQEVFEDYGSRYFSLLARASGTDTGIDGKGGTATLRGSLSTNNFVIQPGPALVQGFYYELVPDDAGTTKSLPVTTNVAGSPVVWRVFLHLDRAANKVTLTARAGTPNAFAQPPAPVRTATVYELPVCRGTVAAGAGVLTGLVDERTWVANGPAVWTPASQSKQLEAPTFSDSGMGSWSDFAASKWAPLNIVVPPSGKFWVSVSAFIQNTNTPTSTIWCGYRGSGDVTIAADGWNSLTAMGGRIGGTRRTLYTGVSAGAQITLTPRLLYSSYDPSAAVTFCADGALAYEPVL